MPSKRITAIPLQGDLAPLSEMTWQSQQKYGKPSNQTYQQYVDQLKASQQKTIDYWNSIPEGDPRLMPHPVSWPGFGAQQVAAGKLGGSPISQTSGNLSYNLGIVPNTGAPNIPPPGSTGGPTSSPRQPKTGGTMQGLSFLPYQSYTPYDPRFAMAGGSFSGGSGGTAAGSTLTGAPPANYDPAYGGIPKVPNPTATQTDVLQGNIDNLGKLYSLATGTGSASAAGARTQLDTALPGATGAMGTALGNVSNLLAGQIPPDVLIQMQQQAAERGIATGMPGSQNNNAAYLRALGLNSLGLQQQGLAGLGSLVGMAPTGPAFNPASMLMNPETEQGWQYLANVLNAAPQPGAAGRANLASLLQGLNRGQGQTGPTGSPLNAQPQPPPHALGFGFGTLGQNQGPGQGPGSLYGGQSYYEGSNPADSNLWDQFYGGNNVAPPTTGYAGGADYGNEMGAPATGYDMSGQNAWDFTSPEAFMDPSTMSDEDLAYYYS